jgi:outer membrane protein TolC
MQSILRHFLTGALAAIPATLAAQQRVPGVPTPLSLADAVRLAERENESVRIARAGADRASGQHIQARSQMYPQVTGSASYQRALQLQFEEIGKRVPSDTSGSGTDSSGGFANSPLARVFASPNTMILGVTASEVVYSGGRVKAGVAASDAGMRAADLAVRTARAQLIYDVAQAYYDAQVAERLLAIADSSLAQTDRALTQTQLGRDVGNTAEYDLIRARVTRDNARPVVIGARTQRDVALLRLRQLLHLPSDQTLALTTALDENVPVNAGDLRAAANVQAIADTSVTGRSSVRQAAELVHMQESQLKIVRGQRLPAVSLSTNYQRFAYPTGVFEDKLRYYFPNWTVSLGASIPFFTGGRQRGDQMVAEANLAEAHERYHQAVLGAVLDAQIAQAQLEQAQATLLASAGTDEQAARGYAIAEVRFSEGIATQLELAQARVDLQTARANRVTAARGLALARLRVALLGDLPVGAAVGGQ